MVCFCSGNGAYVCSVEDLCKFVLCASSAKAGAVEFEVHLLFKMSEESAIFDIEFVSYQTQSSANVCGCCLMLISDPNNSRIWCFDLRTKQLFKLCQFERSGRLCFDRLGRHCYVTTAANAICRIDLDRFLNDYSCSNSNSNNGLQNTSKAGTFDIL